MNRPASHDFQQRLLQLRQAQAALLQRPNLPRENSARPGNGIFERWQHPVITRDHVPLEWRCDFNPESNPYLMERFGINSTFNAGALEWQGKFLLVVRVEGVDRKSFFAIAESETGVDGFRFWPRPLALPETDKPDINVYDMRLTHHEDGFVYGLFCTERKDESRPDDPTAASAQCGIVRTKDLLVWERLPDMQSGSAQQRNVVLHPEFVDGKYGLYTRPQEGFVSLGRAAGICWSLTDSMERAVIGEEHLVDPRAYHSINEAKNGQGPPPLKTELGWLHLAHGVRQTAAGLRYVLYVLLSDLQQPWQVTHRPAGYLLAPSGPERVGDVFNVLFSNGWICDQQGRVLIYYASSDTRLHVATSSIGRLLDYCVNTPADGHRSVLSLAAVNRLIDSNANLDSRSGPGSSSGSG